MDLWFMGIYFTDFIYNKSVLGFMAIKDERIYGKVAGDINPHKSEHGFSIINHAR